MLLPYCISRRYNCSLFVPLVCCRLDVSISLRCSLQSHECSVIAIAAARHNRLSNAKKWCCQMPSELTIQQPKSEIKSEVLRAPVCQVMAPIGIVGKMARYSLSVLHRRVEVLHADLSHAVCSSGQGLPHSIVSSLSCTSQCPSTAGLLQDDSPATSFIQTCQRAGQC